MNIIKSKTLKLDYFSNMKAFFNLMKPRVMSLVLFTCMVGMIVSLTSISLSNSIISLLAVAMGSGAAGALNMWYESDLDALMSRTCLRPIPTGKVKKKQALYFGIILSILSTTILYYSSNFLSSALLVFTIGFYFFVYTIWLKRRTPQNIVIGGAAGALPPVIGWTIATGQISIEPIILFLIIFFWTPSHFWALSLYKAGDYKRAKIPMLPIIAGTQRTKLNIFVYSLLMTPVVIAPYFFDLGGTIYLTVSLVMTSYYVLLCYNLLKENKSKDANVIARKIFVYSIFYLFVIFFLLLIESLLKLI